MTEEIAFKLGVFDFPRFYSQVLWQLNKEPFELFNYFKWSFPTFFGTSCKISDDMKTYFTDWENLQIGGTIKFDLINSTKLKLAYIRGNIKSGNCTVSEQGLYFVFANSYDIRDFLAEFIEEVLTEKFGKLEFSLELGQTNGTCPGTPHIKLKARKEIIDYLVDAAQNP